MVSRMTPDKNNNEDRESLLFDSFNKALEYKKCGKLDEAISELEKSCNPPSINTGHYSELFKIWRMQNSDNLKNSQYDLFLPALSRLFYH